MKKLCKVKAIILLGLILSTNVLAQQESKKATITFWEGMVVGGYVNDGAFVNFGGPTIKIVRNPTIKCNVIIQGQAVRFTKRMINTELLKSGKSAIAHPATTVYICIRS